MTSATKCAVEDRDPPPACPARFNLAAYVLAAAARTPKKTALEVWDETATCWTYRALDRAVRGTMTGLHQAGLRPGDRMFLRLGNSADFPILFLAANGLGTLPVPVSPQLTVEEVAALATELQPKLAARSAGLSLPKALPVLEEADFRPFQSLPPADFADTAADDPAYVIYTSGTGGTPKAVIHAQRAVYARRMMWTDWYDLRSDDRMLHAGAFNWTYTLGTGLMDPWAIGATALVYAGRPDRAAWSRLIAQAQPTLFAAAPGVYRQLLASGGLTRSGSASLRHGLSAGDRLPPQTRAAWTEATGTDIHSALGMSEVSTYISECPAHPGKPQPQKGRRIAVLDQDAQPLPHSQTGRLAVAATDPGLMLGYWQNGHPDLPHEIRLVTSLPRTVTGKIRKRDLQLERQP
ncbi:class I adenylate-forming enzyme family protein [Halovulum sp. GXIMD14793]